MSESGNTMMLLGEIKGQLEGINNQLASQSQAITSLSNDVVALKVAGGRHGAIAGIATSVGVVLLIESIKSALHSGSGGA